MANQVIASEGLERAIDLILADTNYISVGTGTTAPSQANTQLVTETARVTTTKTYRFGKRMQARGFFTNANLPTTMKEAGWFENASGTANTGKLFSRALIDFTKANQDLLLVLEVTFVENT